MMVASTGLPGHFVNGRGFVESDRRVKSRRQAFKFGIINCAPDRRILGLIKNLSTTGAMIQVENSLEIPDEFALTIESESLTRLCRVAWKNPKQVAVTFEGSRRDNANERRHSPRRSLNALGWIRLDGGFAARECRIVDVSNTGVRLALSLADKIPAAFTVLFSRHAPGRRVRTIWRRGNHLGAKFI